VPPAAVLPFASGIAAAIVALIAWWQLSLHKVRIFPAGARAPWHQCALLVPAGMAAACTTGWLWLQLAEAVPWMASQLQQSRAVAEVMRAPEWIGLVVLAVAVAPVAEEFIFRGLVYHGLRRTHGFAWSLLWSSLFFTAVHPPLSSVPVFGLAAVNAWIMERTGRLWPCVLVHAGYNAFVLCLQ
jgi:ABC-2 type transport system permease protein